MAHFADPWVRDFSDASRMADDVAGLIQERNDAIKSKGDPSRLVAAARRKIAMLMAKSDRLETGLRAAAEKSQLNATEVRRREDLLLALRFKAKEMAAVLTSAQSAANRSALLGRDGRPLVAVETERTASRDNRGLVALQQEIIQEQDSELEELESTVATTKHIALTINGELDLHRHLLDDLDDNLQSTNARVQLAKKKMSIFMRRSDNTCNMLLVMMLAAGLVFVALVVYSILKIVL
ncbi:hypothetical protein CLOM_g14808 [Closterium sp. NIES-68]|nr:hypothetical protein CLOM_g14808 [Closterium sp. NIES-68]GJP71221.1 hypothetical protein CLOP_g2077 [Closterium sp. NIES-67]